LTHARIRVNGFQKVDTKDGHMLQAGKHFHVYQE